MSWPFAGGCCSDSQRAFLGKACALFRKRMRAFRKWVNGLFAERCQQCGSPMRIVRHKAGPHGEWLKVYHCDKCNDEYILF